MMKQETPLDSALKEVGGASALSRLMGITSQAIGQWRRVPAERVLQVERLTGVSRHDLRPDLYPRETAGAA